MNDLNPLALLSLHIHRMGIYVLGEECQALFSIRVAFSNGRSATTNDIFA